MSRKNFRFFPKIPAKAKKTRQTPGETPTQLSVAGLDDAPLVMTQSIYNKVTKEKHDVPRRAIKSLYEDLEQALFVFEVL